MRLPTCTTRRLTTVSGLLAMALVAGAAPAVAAPAPPGCVGVQAARDGGGMVGRLWAALGVVVTVDAVGVRDGILTITGDPKGNTAGMEWGGGQRYGRWEGRVRAPASDPTYNALLLLWPDAENFPVGGEIDFMEMMDHTRQKTNVFL